MKSKEISSKILKSHVDSSFKFYIRYSSICCEKQCKLHDTCGIHMSTHTHTLHTTMHCNITVCIHTWTNVPPGTSKIMATMKNASPLIAST